MFRALLSVLALAAGTASLAEVALVGPELAGASRFGQTDRPDLIAAAAANGITSLRDEIYWERVEQGPGQYSFDQPMTLWPEALAAHGGQASLIVNHRHSAHDDGQTPFTSQAMQAQADFVAAALARFPAIRAVEVGNEINSPNFITGPVQAADLEARAAFHVAQLADVKAAARAQDPEVRVLGGGVHSIPLGYLAHVSALGGAEQMDALAIHPYDTPPESFPAQLAELRRMPAFAEMPVEVTEFGLTDATAAPGYLLRYYCTMALSGVTHAVWYPLADRGDGLAPLLTSGGEITPVGRTFKFIARELQGRAVRDVSPDPFTRACLFGEDRLVIWGAERRMAPAEGLVAFGPDGVPVLSGPLRLSESEPLLFRATGGPVAVEQLNLAPQTVLADSFLQYGYPVGDALRSAGDGFERFGRLKGREHSLRTRPGQERGGVPWVPYRAPDADGGLRLLPDILLPAGSGARPFEIVHRYVAMQDGPVRVQIALAPLSQSADGLRLGLLKNGEPVFEKVVVRPSEIDHGPLELRAGDEVEIVVGPNGTTQGDDSRYRFRILQVSEASL
ncbi:hypothetical protein [Aliiruegeria lutimaris]|uniref:Glycosyl hydrolase catalytic core n=1 Tax=Aliiruegeria lutimaris TaxID=571298 RepID=A0A1G9HT32_9RHOB|nr:hypothetical protein [Aliiruegeria lutimaris]SDL15966.1 hypothetical protein SAMN04488026_107013 [Aliiruegeria lutimaris]